MFGYPAGGAPQFDGGIVGIGPQRFGGAFAADSGGVVLRGATFSLLPRRISNMIRMMTITRTSAERGKQSENMFNYKS